jgi:acetylornithine deacetylase/succinyl-diaminopimelate desuccinylase-like protein
MIVGERTGENGDELLGRVCTASRGVIRLRIIGRGARGHTGVASAPHDLLDLLVEARGRLRAIMDRRLTRSDAEGWLSGARFPFLNVGEPGVYNITAAEGTLGVEIRPIPEDDTESLVVEVMETAEEIGLECVVDVHEAGVVCPPDNPFLRRLVDSVSAVGGAEAILGKKLPGSSARFAPGGNQVVWGQSGIGPHSAEERHFIPSVEPYLQVLDHFSGS